MSHGKRLQTEGGIALLIVLWVLTILMVIVFSFSLMARTETLSVMSFKGGIEKKFLAEAGIQRGLMELFYRDVYKDQNVELEGREVWRADGMPHEVPMGEGHYIVRITDEAGKVDINTASDVVLKNLFVNTGISEEDADGIVDSLNDWKDPDDLHRLNGAESDYYQSLPSPYKAKNAKFDAVEELLLVKGITPDILYGSREKKGIIDFLTVHAKSTKINVNAAPQVVLMAIPGMTPEYADSIISLRETKELNAADIQGILGTNYAEAAHYITTGGSGKYTLDASGMKPGEKGTYSIRATVNLANMNQFTYLYYKSPVTLQE
jgi:general secretion pathway protein K